MKIYKPVFAAAFFLFVSYNISSAQEGINKNLSINDFSLLLGKWETDFGKFKYYEEWKTGNEKFFGEGYRIKNGERSGNEQFILINIHGYISYIATVGKQQPILFALVEVSNNKYVFENKEHDFPQRLIYNFINENSIKVFVEGEMDGKLEKDEYNLTRVNE